AAEKLRGKRTSPDIALFGSPLSGEIYLQALKKGVLRQFVEVGAVIVNPGLDSHALSLFGVTPEQTVATTAIEAQYSSFSRDADRYIVSPVTAAAAALSGRIVDPRGV
ncbi:MAG: 3-isopropylmalate dehydratase large subunit, partial [Candidatus Zixiibacteriota bacterium]